MRTVLPVPHELGGHCASSAFRDLVAFYGAEDGAPSEALLFALSGSLDFLYWRRPGAEPPIYLLGRTGPLEAHLAARLGIRLRAVRPPSRDAAWNWLRRTLASGHPALVLADVGELPYLKARTHFTGHRLLVTGIDEEAGRLYVLDNDRGDVQEITEAEFEASWSSTAFPEPVEHRYFALRPPVSRPDLAEGLYDAVADTVRQLDGGGTPFVPASRFDGAGGVGLPGMAAFAGDLPLWPEHFPGDELNQALRAVYLYVEKAGTGFGGFFRGIYGMGLEEASDIVTDPAFAEGLRAAGIHYQNLGRAWTAFAASCRSAAPLAPVDPAAALAPLIAQAAELLTAEQAARDQLSDVMRSE